MAFSRISHAGGAVITTLGGDITSGDVAATITQSTGWPDGATAPFYVRVDPNLATEEKILVTARTGLTLTGLVRGVDGTSAFAHASGATILHCISATEADEANQAAKATLGTVTTKGDLLAATGSAALARVPAGANGTFVTYDNTQPAGLAASLVQTAGLADGAVTSTKILDGTIVTADLADSSVTSAKIVDGTIVNADIANATIAAAKLVLSDFVHGGTYSATTDTAATITVSHGASFTPTRIAITPSIPDTGANRGFPCVSGLTATTFSLTYQPTAGTMNSVAVTGYFTVYA